MDYECERLVFYSNFELFHENHNTNEHLNNNSQRSVDFVNFASVSSKYLFQIFK